MNNNEERRDARAIVRTYKDDDGKTKNVYQTIGSAWVSPHASTITVQIETLPISKEWNGKIYINAPYEKKSDSPTHELNKQIHKDVVLEDIEENPISLDDVVVPF